MKKTDANFMKSLEGSVAGLQVNSLTGQPGAYASTTIRGVGSMNSGTEPLYVIDGIAIYTLKRAFPRLPFLVVTTITPFAARAP